MTTSAINISKLMTAFDESTDMLDAAHVTRAMVAEIIGGEVKATEFCNALNSIIVCDVIAERIREERDPAYWEEAYSGE